MGRLLTSVPNNVVDKIMRKILEPVWDKLSVQEFNDDDFDAYITERCIHKDHLDILSVWIEDGAFFIATTLVMGPFKFPLSDPDVIPKIQRKLEELVDAPIDFGQPTPPVPE